MKKRIIAILLTVACLAASLTGCAETEAAAGTYGDTKNQQGVADKLAGSQSTPTDIDFSLERYNLIRRAYWVNGQREKADTLICEVDKPLGYIVLFTESGSVVGSFVVDGKVSSLNSFLTPSTVDTVEKWSSDWATTVTTEIADVDGSYGENDNGIFFFTPDGKYLEWTGTYLYSDIPFSVDDPVLTVKEGADG